MGPLKNVAAVQRINTAGGNLVAPVIDSAVFV
jgi:hypothetical protein